MTPARGMKQYYAGAEEDHVGRAFRPDSVRPVYVRQSCLTYVPIRSEWGRTA